MKKTDKTDVRKNDKIEPIRITDDMLLDREMDEFLRQSIIEEADRLEEELNSDPELMGIGASDDLFLKIKAQLQEMGVWEEDEEETEGDRKEGIASEEGEAAGDREERTAFGKGRIGGSRKDGTAFERRKEAGREDRKEEIASREERPAAGGKEERTAFGKGRIAGSRKEEAASERRKAAERENRKEEIVSGKERPAAGGREERTAFEEGRTEGAHGEEQRNIYEFLSEEDRQALELGRKIRMKRKKKRKYWKHLAASVAVVVVIFAVGMQGGASRNWILGALDKIMTNSGNGMQINYQDEQENMRLNEKKEQEAWDRIKEELNIPVIRFSYKPEGMVFEEASISKKTGEANLYYKYNGTIVNVYLESGEKNSAASFVAEENAVLQDIVVSNQKIEIEIWNVTTESVESYAAAFEYQDVRYFIGGRFSFEEMRKMMGFIYLY